MAEITVQVGASADDAFENSIGTTAITGTSMNPDEDDEWCGWIFRGLGVLDGVDITDAECNWWITSSTNDEPQCEFFGHAVDDSPAFEAGSSNTNISARRLTAAVEKPDVDITDIGLTAAGWHNLRSWTGGGTIALVLQYLVQELADNGYLASGVFCLFCTSSSGDSARDFNTQTYDGDTSHAATFTAEYTVGGGGDTHSRTLEEQLTTSTLFTVLEIYRRLFSDSAGVLGSIADTERQTIHSRATSEPFALSTDALLDYYIARLVFDTAAFSDSTDADAQRIVTLAVLENMTLATGSADWELFPVQLRQVAETMALSTALSRNTLSKRAVAEMAAFATSIRRLAVSLRMQSAAIGLADGNSKPNKTFRRAIAEQVAISNVLVKSLRFYRTLSSILALSDDKSHLMLYRRVLSDGAALVDDVARQASVFRSVSDSMSMGDAVAVGKLWRRSVANSLAVATSAVLRAVYAAAIADSVGLGTSVQKRAIILRTLNDTVDAATSYLRQSNANRVSADNLGIATHLARAVTALRRVSAAMGLSDDAGEPAGFSFPDYVAFLPPRGRTYELQRSTTAHLPKRGHTFEMVAA